MAIMSVQSTMDYILGNILEDLDNKYHFECHRTEGFLFIDAPDRSVGVKYLNDTTITVVAEYLNKPGFKQDIKTAEVPSMIMNLLNESI